MTIFPDRKHYDTSEKQKIVEHLAEETASKYGLIKPRIIVVDGENFDGIAIGNCIFKGDHCELKLKNRYGTDGSDTFHHEVVHAVHLANNSTLASGRQIRERMLERLGKKTETKDSLINTFGQIAAIHFSAELTASYSTAVDKPLKLLKENGLDPWSTCKTVFDCVEGPFKAFEDIPNDLFALTTKDIDEDAFKRKLSNLMFAHYFAGLAGGHIGTCLADSETKLQDESVLFLASPRIIYEIAISSYLYSEDLQEFQETLVNDINNVQS